MGDHWQPLWFTEVQDEWAEKAGERGKDLKTFVFNGDYWQKRSKQEFDHCPDLF